MPDLAHTLSSIAQARQEQADAVPAAHAALDRLCDAMAQKTGQAFIIKSLLYSLWNGSQTANLNDLLALDWSLRKDLLAVFMAFGYELPASRLPEKTDFFYAAIEKAIKSRGLFDWFTEA